MICMKVRGFTLIELMIVLAVLGLLLGICVPRYFHNVDKAKESALRQDLATMRDAIDKYGSDNGQYPNALSDIETKNYIRKIPTDPFTDRADSWIIVAPAQEGRGNVFDVKSGARGHGMDGTDYATW